MLYNNTRKWNQQFLPIDKTDDKYPTNPSLILMSTFSASLKNSPGTFSISQDHCSWQPFTAQTNTNSNVQTIIPFKCISQLHVNPSATAGAKNLLKITPIHSIAAESALVSDQLKQLDPSGYLFNFEEKCRHPYLTPHSLLPEKMFYLKK